MNDDRKLERLSAYFDGEVSDVERAAVEDLLKSSAEARDALGDIRGISQLLGELPQEELDDGFAARVLRLAGAESTSQPVRQAAARRRRFRNLIAAVACTAASLLVLSSLFELAPLREAPPSREVAQTSRPGGGMEMADSRFVKAKRPAPPAPGGRLKKTEHPMNRAAPASAEMARRGVKSQALPSRGLDRFPYDALSAAGSRKGRLFTNDALVPPIPLGNSGAAGGVRRNDRSVLIDDLKNLSAADVGKVITAVENSVEGIAVVKLVVVDCEQGLDALQVLLTRNSIERHPDRLTTRHSAGQRPRAVGVFVQATAGQFSAALRELRVDRRFRSLRVGHSIPLSMLDLPSLSDSSHTFRHSRTEAHRPEALPGRHALKGMGRARASQTQSPERKTRLNTESVKDSAGGKKALAGDSTQAGRSTGSAPDQASRAAKAKAKLGELERISRHLSLSLSPEILRAMSASPSKSVRVAGSSTANTALGSTTAPRCLNVLFVLQDAPPAKRADRNGD